MRPRSILILAGVAVIFFCLLGFTLAKRFWFPREITSVSAVLKGEEILVGTPVGGIVSAVHVEVGDDVKTGDDLFAILPRTESDLDNTNAVVIRAERGGIVTSIATVAGTFVKPNDTLAYINDLSSRTLSIDAVMAVAPEDLHRLEVSMNAEVSAPSVNGGDPFIAQIVSIDPVYDGMAHTVDVRLKIVRFPEDMESLRAGVPLAVTVTVENQNSVKDFMRYIGAFIVSDSNAKEE